MLLFKSLSSSSRLSSRCIGTRRASTDVPQKAKILVVGGGAGGLTVANQIYNRFRSAGNTLNDGDIAIFDASYYHHYQPGWTLVGGGLKDKYTSDLRRPLANLVSDHIQLVSHNVASFFPKESKIQTTSGAYVSYDILIVAAGLQINWNSIPGLTSALANPNSNVSSIYSFDVCDKTWRDIEAMRTGKAIFTQPAGIVKCAGAPQKIMWLAWDHFQKTSRSYNIKIEFWTGMPTMFSVPKYSEILNSLRVQRKIEARFEHNLISISPDRQTATFKRPDGKTVETDYTLMHVVPPMSSPEFIKGSPIADPAGWVDVDQASLQHKNPEYKNIFSLGDCAGLPTSKTAAAITSQAPVVTENVFSLLNQGSISQAAYDGYTSCPLTVSYDKLLLAEFVYGAKPKETFNQFFGVDQGVPRRIFMEMKKQFFPWVYFNHMLQGRWFGPRGFRRPSF